MKTSASSSKLNIESFLREAERAFCEIMEKGWASGQSIFIKNSEEFSGFKVFSCTLGIFTVVDMWNMFGHFGITTMEAIGFPFWAMQYRGFNEKEASDFLKRALSFNYKNRQFLGGRGPKSFPELQFQYTNFCDGDFSRFHGREDVVMSESGVICTTNYSGGIILRKIELVHRLEEYFDRVEYLLPQAPTCPQCGKLTAPHGTCLDCLGCAELNLAHIVEQKPLGPQLPESFPCPQCQFPMKRKGAIWKCPKCGDTFGG